MAEIRAWIWNHPGLCTSVLFVGTMISILSEEF